jgi:membrane protease YdiL (CAAX protease family)
MRNAAAAAGAITAAVVISLVWGRALGYLDDRSDTFRRAALGAMGFSARAPAEVRALMLSAIYYGVGLAAAVAMAALFGIRLSSLASWSEPHGWMFLLGAVGEISLANLVVDLLCRITRTNPQRFAEIDEIPWMVGVRQLPPGAAPLGAALGGMIEELFYRGVLLLILIERAGVPPWAAVLAAGALFCLQQLLQVRTAFQAMVVASACVAISLVGGLLVVTTGSVIPALLSHASFVVFFVGRKSDRERASRRVAETAAL